MLARVVLQSSIWEVPVKKTVAVFLLAMSLVLGGAPMAAADTPPPIQLPREIFCLAYPDYCADADTPF
jgi:hypothetical protein